MIADVLLRCFDQLRFLTAGKGDSGAELIPPHFFDTQLESESATSAGPYSRSFLSLAPAGLPKALSPSFARKIFFQKSLNCP